MNLNGDVSELFQVTAERRQWFKFKLASVRNTHPYYVGPQARWNLKIRHHNLELEPRARPGASLTVTCHVTRVRSVNLTGNGPIRRPMGRCRCFRDAGLSHRRSPGPGT